jgi:hypothetical protein
MKLENPPEDPGSGMSGTLRLLVMTGIACLLLLAILLLLGAIPGELFTHAGGRALGVLALLALASVAFAWLMRGRG